MAERKESLEAVLRTFPCVTWKECSVEEELRIVPPGGRGLERLGGVTSTAVLCRRAGMDSNLYCRWAKEFPRLRTGRSGCEEAAAGWRTQTSRPMGAS